MIYNLYIFSKTGTCLFYNEWSRPHSTLRDMPDEDRKLMFGLLFSLKQLMNKVNPVPCVVQPLRPPRPSRSAALTPFFPLPLLQ